MKLRLDRRALRTTCRALLVAAWLLAPACGGSNGPTAEKCPAYAGTYTSTFSGPACAEPTDTTVVVEQLGCHVQAILTGMGAMHGNVDSAGAWQFDVFPDPPCQGSFAGTATINGTMITGYYSGAEIGTGCCPSASISFTFVRK